MAAPGPSRMGDPELRFAELRFVFLSLAHLGTLKLASTETDTPPAAAGYKARTNP